MKKTLPYSLYKSFYNQFPADNYNAAKKTIEVELPEYKKPSFPKDWERFGNHYTTPNGCRVYFWNSGFAENFIIEYKGTSKTFSPGLYAREQVIDYVNSL